MAKGEYKVGYKKPPEEHQFKKGGPSPNPAGRPSGARGLKTDLAAELGERVTYTENGKRRRKTKQQIMIKAQIQKAMKADTKAATFIIGLVLRSMGFDGDQAQGTATGISDEELIEAYLRRRMAERGQQ